MKTVAHEQPTATPTYEGSLYLFNSETRGVFISLLFEISAKPHRAVNRRYIVVPSPLLASEIQYIAHPFLSLIERVPFLSPQWV
jgi:hypothetical protein